MKIVSLMKSNKGFTLIELMIVIGIMGILAGIVVPQLTGMQGKARDAAIASVSASLKTALEVYYAEKGSYPEYGEEIASNSPWDDLNSTLTTIQLKGLSEYNITSISYSDNSTDTDKYLIEFVSSNTNGAKYYLGEKAFGDTSQKASDL
jgi:type II secretion system protein G